MNFNLPEMTNFDETIGMFKYYLIATGLCFLPLKGLTQYKINEIGQRNVTIQIDTLHGLVERVGCEGEEIHSICDTLTNQIYISGLEPSQYLTICVEVKSKDGLNSFLDIPVLSQSKSSGEIKIFFNNPVDPDFQKENYAPDGTTFAALQNELVLLIRNAKQTIDLAAYNTNETFLVNELKNAHSRGVVIRVVTDDETGNFGWADGAPFPILYGNIGSGLMHNKFLIVDAESMDSAWVVTGAMNFTTNQMRKDPNHLLFIQDKSLAKAYTLEFNEMWGSSGSLPNLQNAKFGSQKTQNTPIFFNLNGIPVELYFSPSDKTTQKIVSKLEQAKEEQLLALMIFTNWDLRDQVADNLRDDIRTRWIVEDVEFSQSVINLVQNLNGSVRQHVEPEIFHHKYAILDENTNQPVLITGSHNWTYAAETVNDENTLIFYDRRIANIFRQEFEARWKDILTSTDNQAVNDKIKIFPNPSSGLVSFSKPLKNVCVLNNLGSPVLCFGNEVQQIFLDLPSGIYFLLHEEGSEKIFITR